MGERSRPVLALIVLAGIIGGLLYMTATAEATQQHGNNCNYYENHNGNIPGSYDYGYGEEWHKGKLIDTFRVAGGQNAGRPSNGGTWDKVWKCHQPPTTTTTTVIVTTTTIPDTTTTTVPETTTTTVPETTTTTQPEVTTTTQPPETTTTTTPQETTTTSTLPPETTTSTTTVTSTTVYDPCDEEGACLPVTGAPLGVWALIGGLAVALGAGLLQATRRDT